MRRWPCLLGRVILMSGALPPEWENWPPELASCPVLTKPFGLAALGQLVATVLAKADSEMDLLEGNGHG